MAVFLIGFLSQALFFGRTLFQWIQSERAKKVISPTLYWILSIAASYLFFIYGWLRNDFAILFGQLISYYIYMWNLHKTGVWDKIYTELKWILLFIPVIALLIVIKNGNYFVDNFISNSRIPIWLLILGSSGQMIFTMRFVYQWIYSMRKNQSLLPFGFWIISLIGSVLIVIYGLIRFDPILILGQSIGLIAYARNIILYRNELKYASHD